MCNYNDHDDRLKEAVWSKGHRVPEKNPNVWRKDDCGALIKKDEYDNRDSDYGWQIDHIDPVARGGSDNITNLRPLHWLNNESRQDRIENYCRVRAIGNQNIDIKEIVDRIVDEIIRRIR